MNKAIRSAALLMMVLATHVTSGVEGGLLMKEETPGERFRRAIEQIAKSCESRTLARGEICGEVAKLKPADPFSSEAGRYAHSIQIPNPLPEDSGYRPGMTPQQYFDHLCRTEAGEFIYRTVENVEGLYMMRPRQRATDHMQEHLYALEDPYGHTTDESFLVQDTYVQPATGRYQFLELPVQEQSREIELYRRYYRDEHAHPGREHQTAMNGRGVFVPYVVAEKTVTEIKSRYGYTWRGIKRPHDREMGIAGGELMIVDLQTNELMAVRRGYIRTGFVQNSLTGVWWLTGPSCPNRGIKPAFKFIQKVLKPLPIGVKEKTDDN